MRMTERWSVQENRIPTVPQIAHDRFSSVTKKNRRKSASTNNRSIRHRACRFSAYDSVLFVPVMTMMMKTVCLVLMLLAAFSATFSRAQIEINGLSIGCPEGCITRLGGITSDVEETLKKCSCDCDGETKPCITGDSNTTLSGDIVNGK